jgi:glutamate carboxypeptidase
MKRLRPPLLIGRRHACPRPGRSAAKEAKVDSRKALKYCRSELPLMLKTLKTAVEMESPSGSKADLDRIARFFASQFRQHHAAVRLLPHAKMGAAVLAEFWGGRGKSEKPILLLGHLDTVWAKGMLASMPFRIRGGKAYGPGVLDMKAGIVCGLWAVRALQEMNAVPPSPLRFFLNPDEEVGSQAFRKEIEREARRARAVLVLEPAAAGGALKTARKGVGEFEIIVHGRSAHAGVAPQQGVNAISELVRQLLRVERLAEPRRGLTVNVGVVEGGTRSNVVPEKALVRVDVRIPENRDGKKIERAFHGLQPVHPGARLEVRGGINRPPFERKMAAALFAMAQRIGRDLGLNLKETFTGGGSDGNFCAALGIRTLDGLGAVGDGAHARDEHVVIADLPRRAALVAGLLAAI